jgi:hypothetical protein
MESGDRSQETGLQVKRKKEKGKSYTVIRLYGYAVFLEGAKE